ncbi:class I SAM-dependent methyltransferase [Mycolicibacterium moriokaense]|nr:class I SAM-dependent methyltransferase [Mycolicibacterium moriokaense]
MTPAATVAEPLPIDPLAPAPRGEWTGHGVRVRRRIGPHRPHRGVNSVCNERFCVQRDGHQLTVIHDLTSAEISDDLTLRLEELADAGLLRGRRDFELVFTGVVRSTVDGGAAAFLHFYRNSIARLESGLASFAPVHERAAELVHGRSLIDLGSCFGFFPLRVARRDISVLATDLSAPTMRLLDLAATRLRRPVRTMCCDATRVPLPDRHADTVTALHLLEHLTSGDADAVLAEAIRLARRRVVIAVPFEDEPRACYGHVQRFDVAVLNRLGERIGARYPGVGVRVDEHHGGWLIIDRRPSSVR